MSISRERCLSRHGRIIALWDKTDQWHLDAESAFQRLVTENTRFITTEFVLLECGNAAARRPYRSRVGVLRRMLAVESLIAVPTEAELDAAWNAYDRNEANSAGVVDHITFQIMRRLGIQQAFTNDRHFAAAGLETLF